MTDENHILFMNRRVIQLKEDMGHVNEENYVISRGNSVDFRTNWISTGRTETYRVGMLLPLTGPSASGGQDTKRAWKWLWTISMLTAESRARN